MNHKCPWCHELFDGRKNKLFCCQSHGEMWNRQHSKRRAKQQLEASRRYQKNHRQEICAKMRNRRSAAALAYRRSMSAVSCPVCVQEFDRVDNAERVCSVHLSWYVTICAVCGEVSFSDRKGYCLTHGHPIMCKSGREVPQVSFVRE